MKKYWLITFKWIEGSDSENLLTTANPVDWFIDYHKRDLSGSPPILLFAMEITKKQYESLPGLHWVDDEE